MVWLQVCAGKTNDSYSSEINATFFSIIIVRFSETEDQLAHRYSRPCSLGIFPCRAKIRFEVPLGSSSPNDFYDRLSQIYISRRQSSSSNARKFHRTHSNHTQIFLPALPTSRRHVCHPPCVSISLLSSSQVSMSLC
jgi:hypothetical protein